MKYWQLNCAIAAYVAAQCGRYISIKLTDEQTVTNSSGEEVKFHHPLFQSCIGFSGEFIVVGALYIYYLIKDPVQIKTAQVRFRYFLLPALCDFLENTLLVFGLMQVFPSVTSMTRALTVPLTAWIGRYLIVQKFSWN